VRATVRSVSNKEKVAHLESLAEALPGTLAFHEGDLLKDGSFDEVMKGADLVFHMASPFLSSHDDPYVRATALHDLPQLIFYSSHSPASVAAADWCKQAHLLLIAATVRLF
jgi:uncharacterized protein YbjT (DUF2867 family)